MKQKQKPEAGKEVTIKKRKVRKSTIDKHNYLNKKLQIENKYVSLLTLIDTIYPPCTTRKSKYLCIHPHCDQRFASKGALHFHITQSHLVIQTKNPLPHPNFLKSMEKTESNEAHALTEADTSDTNTVYSVQQTPTLPPPILKKKPLPPPVVAAVLTPSPSPSPFSLYHKKKSTLSSQADQFLNSIYPPLQCPCCAQHFNRKTNVIKHLSDAHLGQEPYHCIYSHCKHPKSYATREGLVYHILRFHDEQSDRKKKKILNQEGKK